MQSHRATIFKKILNQAEHLELTFRYNQDWNRLGMPNEYGPQTFPCAESLGGGLGQDLILTVS
jgi:hypothetical protein